MARHGGELAREDRQVEQVSLDECHRGRMLVTNALGGPGEHAWRAVNEHERSHRGAVRRSGDDCAASPHVE